MIGAGIASINEWANALDAGAKVIALRRNPAPDEQDLNVPRCLFEALGIDIFQGLAFEDRIAFLGQVLKGTAPKRRSWRERIENGRAEGRFEELIGEIDQVEKGRPACACTSAAATARTRAGSTSPASAPAPASSSRRSRCRCCAGSSSSTRSRSSTGASA